MSQDPQSALTLEDCFQRLADIMVASLSADWAKATITAEVADNWTDVLTVAVDSDGLQRGFRLLDHGFLPMNASNTLIHMRNLMKTPGKEPWNKAVFTFTKDGNFNFQVEYPGLDADDKTAIDPNTE